MILYEDTIDIHTCVYEFLAQSKLAVGQAAWVTEFADGTMLRLSVRSGPKAPSD